MSQMAEDVAPSVTQEVQLVLEPATPAISETVDQPQETDSEITVEVPLFEYPDEETPADYEIEYSAAAPVIETQSPAEEPEVVASSWEPAPAEREPDSFPEEKILAFETDPASVTPNESSWLPDAPTPEPPVESLEADMAPTAELDVADVSLPADSQIETPAPSSSDDSDLPAFLRDDPPPAYQLITAYAPEPEPKLFVAPASDPPADSLIDEVDAAFITAGLPTQEAASPAAIAAATSLESIARRLRAGELELRGGAALSSDAATLASVLAALLADG
jgi:hypothetical protein